MKQVRNIKTGKTGSFLNQTKERYDGKELWFVEVNGERKTKCWVLAENLEILQDELFPMTLEEQERHIEEFEWEEKGLYQSVKHCVDITSDFNENPEKFVKQSLPCCVCGGIVEDYLFGTCQKCLKILNTCSTCGGPIDDLLFYTCRNCIDDTLKSVSIKNIPDFKIPRYDYKEDYTDIFLIDPGWIREKILFKDFIPHFPHYFKELDVSDRFELCPLW